MGLSKLSDEEIAELFWSMRDSKDEEAALKVLNDRHFSPVERILVTRDLFNFGIKQAAIEEEKDAWP